MSNLTADTMSALFSTFPRGFVNRQGCTVLAVRPHATFSVADAYQYITGPAAIEATEGLRALVASRAVPDAPTRQEQDAEQDYKKLHFEVATFGGTFTYRSARSLVADSGLRAIDIDDLAGEDEARALQRLLIADHHFSTALCFLSPRGCGVKWVVALPDDWRSIGTRQQYMGLVKYLLFEYGIVADRSGSDISRACYLPHDAQCYLGPQF